MQITQAAKKAAGFVVKDLRDKASWVWEKRTWFLPSVRILKEKYWRKAVATLAVLTIAALLVLVRTVWAQTPNGPTKAPSFAEDYIWPLLAYVSEWIASLLGQLLLWAIDLLIQVSKYNSFLDSNVVSVGWVLVRDVANMFFILIMLVIAFGTMLKIEAYSWKKLLPRLILTALLVNFSKTFIGLLIDFSQVIMLTFVNGYAAAAGGNFMNMFQINKLFSVSAGADFSGTLMTDDKIAFSAALGFALGAVMLGIALIVVLIFAALLVFRIIILWILIVLSPLAFLLGTFPKGQEYYGQWWKQLQGQIIVGPMVAFFLWLSLAALGGGDINSQIKYNENQTGDLNKINESAKISTQTEIGKWDNIASFAVSIAMLLMSLQMISQLGVAGAGLASGALSTIKSKATGLAKKLAVPAAMGLGIMPPIAPVLGLGAGYGAYKGTEYGVKFAGKTYWARKKLELKQKSLKGEGVWKVLGKPTRMIEKAEAKREYAEEELKRVTLPLRGRLKREVEAKRQGGYAFDYEQAAEAQLDSERRKSFAHINSADKFNAEFARIESALPKTTGTAREELLKKYGQIIRMSQDKGFFEDAIRSLAGADQKNNTYQGRYQGLYDQSNIAEGQVKFIRQAIFGKKDNEDISDAEMSRNGSFLRSLAELDTDGDLLYRHLTTVDDKGNYRLRGAKASELPGEIEKVEQARDFAYSKIDKAEQARVRPLFTHVISGDSNVIQADYRGRETARFTGITERNAGSLPIRDGNWLLYGKEAITDPMVRELRKMNAKNNVLHLRIEDLQRIAPHLLDGNQAEGIAKLVQDMGGAANAKEGTFPIQIVEVAKNAAGNIIKDADGNDTYQERTGEKAKTRQEIATLLRGYHLSVPPIKEKPKELTKAEEMAVNLKTNLTNKLTLTDPNQINNFVQDLQAALSGIVKLERPMNTLLTIFRGDNRFQRILSILKQGKSAAEQQRIEAGMDTIIEELVINKRELEKEKEQEKNKKIH